MTRPICRKSCASAAIATVLAFAVASPAYALSVPDKTAPSFSSGIASTGAAPSHALSHTKPFLSAPQADARETSVPRETSAAHTATETPAPHAPRDAPAPHAGQLHFPNGISSTPNPAAQKLLAWDDQTISTIIADPPTLGMVPAANAFWDATKKLFVIPGPAGDGTGAGTIPKGLERFYTQKLDWTADCKDFFTNSDPVAPGALCAWAIAPLDYAHPNNGKYVALAVIKRPAKDQDPNHKKGTIFMNPGGPGFPALNLLQSGSEMSGLAETFDRVAFDPRGVGASLPKIRCASDDAMDVWRKSNGTPDQFDEYMMKQCAKNTGAAFEGYEGRGQEVIDHISTRDLVRDMDMLRSVLGDKKLNYFGYSYGTRIGYYYAMTFPDNYRALVFDGDIDPFEDYPAYRKSHFGRYIPDDPGTGNAGSADDDDDAGLEEVRRAIAASCLKDEGAQCPVSNPDDQYTVGLEPTPAQIDDAYNRMVFLENLPLKSPTPYFAAKDYDEKPVSWADLHYGFIYATYSRSLWPEYIKALRQMVREQDASDMICLADQYYRVTVEADNTRRYGGNDSASVAIDCADAPPSSPGQDIDVACQQTKIPPSAPTIEEYEGVMKAHEPAGLRNILVLSSHLDNATPFYQGVIMAKALKGTLVAVSNANHTAYGQVECATKTVNNYIADPDAFTAKVDKLRAQVANEDTMIDHMGPSGVKTKNLQSNLVTGYQCEMYSFRNVKQPEPEPGPEPRPEPVPAETGAAPAKGTTYHEAPMKPHNLARTGSSGMEITAWALLLIAMGATLAGGHYAYRRTRRRNSQQVA